MNKKIAILAAAMLLVVSAAGCGVKKDNTTAPNTNQTDASSAYGNVDMNKIDGDALTSDNDREDYKGEIGDAEIEIGDAKVIEYGDGAVAIVSFEYKNNSDADTPFTGAVKAEAYQDENRLAPTVVSDVEGIDMLSLSENVAKGDKITVQKAYVLNDTSSQLVIEVTAALPDQNITDILTKTFEF